MLKKVKIVKSKRQEKIIDLIGQYEVETQEELAALLSESGFAVTQATISRDIRELGLTKVSTSDGRQKYALSQVQSQGASEKMSRVLKEGFISSMEASHIVVVKTMPGMAMAVAAALDTMDLSGFAGCIAGDDAIICALCSDADAADLMAKIDKVVK